MSAISLTWLGQSGFLLDGGGVHVACDLYLSDYCRQRSMLDLTRLMPVPVDPATLTTVTHYLITHGHIDHFDPLTVAPVLHASPEASFYCPPACEEVISEFFKEESNRFCNLRSLREYILADDVRLVALPAAHEELTKDEYGEYIAFSYLLLLDASQKAVLFAGDTVSYNGQDNRIRTFVPEGYSLTMVLPVNGRDEVRSAMGILGNFTLDEAMALFIEVDATLFVPCHYGMFAINDIPETLDEERLVPLNGAFVIPEVNVPFAV